MNIHVSRDPQELGELAGKTASLLIQEAIRASGTAHIILATGTSQFETLNQLIAIKEIDWSKVRMFHLDEYLNLPISSPASFRKYLQERFLSRVSPLKATYLIDGETEGQAECERLGALIRKYPIDVALIGIGENAHLAFNDPPANFDTVDPYIIVQLDEACRKQQLGEGWFSSMDDVPGSAISMSVNQILLSKHIVCSVPDKRKADAVLHCVEGPVSNLFPASILQEHPQCNCYLDQSSAILLRKTVISPA
jgi:glucosamine-6-phosphate deaminase